MPVRQGLPSFAGLTLRSDLSCLILWGLKKTKGGAEGLAFGGKSGANYLRVSLPTVLGSAY